MQRSFWPDRFTYEAEDNEYKDKDLEESENQMIVNCSVHQNTNDATCSKDHLEQLKKHTDVVPKNVMADSIFGTEENCEILEREDIENYLKYPSLHKEEKKRYKPEPYS